MSRALFHLAFPIVSVAEAKQFYVEGLGCTLGRESASAITLGLAGHQLVGHVVEAMPVPQRGIYPRHFGLVFLEAEGWQAVLDRARERGLRFFQQPRRRFEGSRIEHATFFLEDPFQNLLEFKHYTHESAIFGERDLTQIGDAE